MFVGRHERVLTLDGDWVHIMLVNNSHPLFPPETRI